MTGDMAQLIVTCELILGFVGLPAVRVLPVGLDNTCCDARERVRGREKWCYSVSMLRGAMSIYFGQDMVG